MRVLALSFSVCIAFIVGVVGCPANETPVGEGEGEGEEGEGEGEEGEGEGEAPSGCELTGCPEGQVCGSIFGPDEEPACFTSCDDGAAPCTTANGLTGECRNIEGFDTPVCRAESGDLGECGNAVSSGCLDELVCVTFPDAELFPDEESICVQGCLVDGDCGDAALGCSNDLQFRVNGGEVQGVCATLTTQNSPCGRRESGLSLCTSGLSCDRQDGESQGTCQ